MVRQFALTGTPLGAQRAYELGIVNELAEDRGAVDGAPALAAQASEHSPFAVDETLRVIQDVLEAEEQLGWRQTELSSETILASDDRIEGVKAFLKKRAPQWNGQ